MNNFILSLDSEKLKKVFKKVFCALLITLFLWFIKLNVVNAATLEPSYYSFNGVENLPFEFWSDPGDISRILTVNSGKDNNGGLYDLNSQNYIIMTMCVVSDNNNDYFITNSGLDGAITNGDIDYLDTGVKCKALVHQGTIYKFYMKVYKWAVPTAGADSYQVSSYFHIRNNGQYGTLYKPISIFITDKSSYEDDSILVANGKGQDIIINQNNTIINKFDDIINSDISDKDKELPDDSKYDDYNEAQGSLTDKVKQADLSNINIGIDKNASSFVWDTLTSFLKANSLIFSCFIAILSIGIIKLALGR